MDLMCQMVSNRAVAVNMKGPRERAVDVSRREMLKWPRKPWMESISANTSRRNRLFCAADGTKCFSGGSAMNGWTGLAKRRVYVDETDLDHD